MERKGQGANFQGANRPGSYSLRGANWPGSENARYRTQLQPLQRRKPDAAD